MTTYLDENQSAVFEELVEGERIMLEANYRIARLARRKEHVEFQQDRKTAIV